MKAQSVIHVGHGVGLDVATILLHHDTILLILIWPIEANLRRTILVNDTLLMLTKTSKWNV